MIKTRQKLNSMIRTSSVQKINLKSYFFRGNRVLSMWQILAQRCKASYATCTYEQQLATLKARIYRTRYRSHSRNGARTRNAHQTKTSVTSIIGKIERFLFGTLDEDSEKQLKQLIEMASIDTRQLANLVTN